MEPYNIDIIGVIGQDMTVKLLKENLTEAAGNDIVLNIDSPGGSVYDGLAQYNVLKDYGGKVTTKINGLAASAASYYALAADNVIAYDTSSFMIHNVFSLAYGDHNILRKEAKENESLTNILAKLYSIKLNKQIDEIKKMMDEETWFYGAEIKKVGFADKIIKSDQQKDKTACLDEGKAKFKIMLNSLDREQYNDELRKAANIASLVNMELPGDPGENNFEGDSTMTLDEALKVVSNALDNNNVSKSEIAKKLNFESKLITADHSNAIAVCKKLNEITGDKDPVEFVENLLTEKKENQKAVRTAKLTELFGAKVLEDKKENVVREYAEQYFDGKEITDEAVNELKENKIFKQLTAQDADYQSKQNEIGIADDQADDKKNDNSNTIVCDY